MKPSDLRRAGRTIGKLRCPWCGGQAQARQNEGKHAYCYCPGCGLTTTARTGVQAELILRAMSAPEIAPEPPPKVQPGAATSPPAAPAKPRGIWEQLGMRS